ncbi:MAG TPA: transposase [Clostridiaceae bacterium]|nr:transposase [Clostridiaceae bacterium]
MSSSFLFIWNYIPIYPYSNFTLWIVVVADKGLNCGDNIAYQIASGNGYIYSQSIRGADQEFKQYVLDQSGYRVNAEYKCKSRIYPREITFTDCNGKKQKVRIDQKQIVFFSQDYADKARYERYRTIAKAQRYLKTPSALTRSISYSAASYIKGIQINEDGEIVKTSTKLYLDEDKIREEEQYDGYYAIITSELDRSDCEIIEIYHNLWKIEETFKISKSELRTRPIYVSLEAHIEAHFLSCFVALLLIRILELRMNQVTLSKTSNQTPKFSAFEIIDSIRNYTCSSIGENFYNFHYIDDIIQSLGKIFEIDLSKKYRSRGEIKKIIAKAKK